MSEKFLSAPQMSAFLRYVVVQTATGNKNRIKAYTVAVDALGKPETFDPQNDPVVRVLAGRLRSTLSAYYEQHPDADVIIAMKPGSYVPSFILRDVSDQLRDVSDHPSDDLDTAISSSDDAESSVEAEAVGSTALSVDLTHAANNQWTVNKASEPHAAGGTLNASYQQTDGDSAKSTVHRLFDGATGNMFAALITRLSKFPKLTAAAALFGAVLIGMFVDELVSGSEPPMLASKMAQDASIESGMQRPRPDSLSLFVSAVTSENSLASQVNTTMSSVFSESGKIRVYRMLRSTQAQRFWPEDYQMSLNVLPLMGETQISVQLVDAQTGRIIHAEILHLSADAPHGLSDEDFMIITDCARRLIREDGPLTRDYKNKTNSL